MEQIQLLNNLSKIIVFLLLFFSFFLITVKSKNRKSNNLFAFFFILIAFDISALFLKKWYLENPIIDNLRIASSLLQLPILYFYVLSVCYSNIKITLKNWTHGLLFSITLFFILFTKKTQTTFLVFQVISEIQYFFYIILIFINLKNYKNIYLENYTNLKKLNYKWLVQMISVLLLAHFFVISKLFVHFTGNTKNQMLFNSIVTISALLVSSYFVLKALYQPQIFSGIDYETVTISNLIKKPKTQKLELNSEAKEKIKVLKAYMKEKEPFLNPELTIQNLASQIGFSQKEVSIIINQYMDKHFFDFINDYRITKAMSILENPKEKELTVLEILYSVGFNSKSSFNTAFKKHSSLTPAEYRKKALSEK